MIDNSPQGPSPFPSVRVAGRPACLHFEPSHEKATQSLNYVARKNGGEINKMKALKLIYLADRYHIRKYGRPVVGDDYYAMKQGPVASMTKDLADKNPWLDETEREYADTFLATSADKLFVISIAPVDGQEFSESDEEALDFAWASFGMLSEWDLVDLTHAFPEWDKHRDSLAHGACRRVRMDYADFFLDLEVGHPLPEIVGVADPFVAAVSEAERLQAWEIMLERAQVQALWNR
jgi:uncharacterized phage-associated protein